MFCDVPLLRHQQLVPMPKASGQAPEHWWDWSMWEMSGTESIRFPLFQRGNCSVGSWNCFRCVKGEMCVSVSWRASAMGTDHLPSQYPSADFSRRCFSSPWHISLPFLSLFPQHLMHWCGRPCNGLVGLGYLRVLSQKCTRAQEVSQTIWWLKYSQSSIQAAIYWLLLRFVCILVALMDRKVRAYHRSKLFVCWT